MLCAAWPSFRGQCQLRPPPRLQCRRQAQPWILMRHGCRLAHQVRLPSSTQWCLCPPCPPHASPKWTKSPAVSPPIPSTVRSCIRTRGWLSVFRGRWGGEACPVHTRGVGGWVTTFLRAIRSHICVNIIRPRQSGTLFTCTVIAAPHGRAARERSPRLHPPPPPPACLLCNRNLYTAIFMIFCPGRAPSIPARGISRGGSKGRREVAQ